MSAGLVKKVLEQLVGVIAAQMLQLVKSVKKFSLNGVFHVSKLLVEAAVPLPFLLGVLGSHGVADKAKLISK